MLARGGESYSMRVSTIKCSAMRRRHTTSLGLDAHYQDIGFHSENGTIQATIAFLAWIP